MRLLYRTGDALHHGVKALLDEAEVGDVEGEVLHEPGGDGVGVGRRQKNVLLVVDAGERKIQIFQNFHLTDKTFLNLLGLVAFTLTSWLIRAMSQEFYTNTQTHKYKYKSTFTSWLIIAVSQETKTTLPPEVGSSMMKAREKVRMWMPV